MRPIVIITSNNEKELPDAFLRRCFFHYIRFPDAETMRRIVELHYPSIKPRLVEEAMRSFFTLRETPGLKRSRRRQSSSTGSGFCSMRTLRRRLCASATPRN